MIRQKSKLIATMVAAVLIVSVVLSGCGTGNKDANPPSASSSSGASTSPSDSAPASTEAPPKDPVEINIIGVNVSSGPIGVQDDPIAEEIERLIGVKMNITSSSAVSDINAKIAAQIASDDLPDIVFFPSNDLMQSAITAHELLPLDDLIAQYGQDLQKNVPVMVQYSKTHMSVDKDGKTDGNTYVLGGLPVGPFFYDPTQTGSVPWARYDLYKKLGYPEINTIDDYISVMKQMVALEPQTADGKKVYGTASNLGDGPYGADWILWASIPGIYGFTVNTYANVVDMLSNDFIDFVGDPNSKFFEAARYWNKIYREGLLDPDSFTMKRDDLRNKVAQGRYVMAQSSNTYEYNTISTKNNEAEKYFVQLPPPKDTEAVWVSVEQPVGTPTQGYGISAKSKHPEEAFKLLNFLASDEGMMLVYNGLKDQTWDDADGKAAIHQDVLDQMNDDPDFIKKTGIYKYALMTFLSGTAINEKYNKPYDLSADRDLLMASMNPAQKDMVQHYGITVPLDLVSNQVKQMIASAPENVLIPPPPQDIQDMSNNVDKYVFDNFLKLITPKTDADYEAAKAKFIEGINKVGNQTVVKWYQDERVKALEEYKKMGN